MTPNCSRDRNSLGLAMLPMAAAPFHQQNSTGGGFGEMVKACARSFSPCWEPSSEHRRWAKGRREVVKSLPVPGTARSPPHRDLCCQSCAAKGPCPVPAHAALAVVRPMPMSPKGHKPQARDLCIGVSGPGSFLPLVVLVGLACSPAAGAGVEAASLPASGMLHCTRADWGVVICCGVFFRQCCLQLLHPSLQGLYDQ